MAHTMRTLKPTEYIVIAVDLTKDWGLREFGPARFIMKVKKEELDTYNRGDFDVAALRERVEFLEF